MSKPNKWHLVEDHDKSRIRCTGRYGECGEPAYACEHSEWNTGNTTGISFFYYCRPCAIDNGMPTDYAEVV